MHRMLPAVFLLFAAGSAHAQIAPVPAGVQPGSRVRVTTTSGKPAIGRVVEVRGDTLYLMRDGATEETSVAAARIVSLDVSTGRHKRRWSGAAVGLVGGMLIGAVVGDATYKPHNCTGDFCDVWGPWPNVVVGAVLLGGVGAATGAALGYGTADSWSPVIRDGVRVGIVMLPVAQPLAFGASLRF